MTLRIAAHTAGSVEGAVDARLDAVALWALQGPGPLDVRPGVVYAPGNPMQVLGTSATSPWAVTVNPGHTVAKKSGVSNGVYYNANDALTTVALAVPPASNSRIDTIYAQQTDAAALVDVDGSTAAVLAAVTGTSGNGGLGATPTVPAVPVGAVALYSVTILSTATAGTSGAGVTITRLFQWTCLRGDPIPVLSQTERDLITTWDGLQVYRLDTHKTETYNGTSWGNGSAAAVTAAAGNSGLITTAWVPFVTAPAVTGDGVKKFLITVVFKEAFSTVAGDTFRFQVVAGGAGVGLWQDVALSAVWGNGRTLSAFDTPAAGAVTYTGSAYRFGGTGTGTVGVSQIIVQQIA